MVSIVSAAGLAWQPAFLVVVLLYFYSHYMFASGAAHIGAMYTAFLSVLIACGAPPLVSALVLGIFSNLMGCTTHYGIGSAPPFFGKALQLEPMKPVLPAPGTKCLNPKYDEQFFQTLLSYSTCAATLGRRLRAARHVVEDRLRPLHLLHLRLPRRRQRLVEGHRPVLNCGLCRNNSRAHLL